MTYSELLPPQSSDYSHFIRNQVVEFVRCSIKSAYYKHLKDLYIGSFANCHRGKDIFRDGELIEGIPIQIKDYWTYTVRGDDYYDEEGRISSGEYITKRVDNRFSVRCDDFELKLL